MGLPGPHPGARPGEGARGRAPGARPGAAGRRELGLPSCRPITRRRRHFTGSDYGVCWAVAKSGGPGGLIPGYRGCILYYIILYYIILYYIKQQAAGLGNKHRLMIALTLLVSPPIPPASHRYTDKGRVSVTRSEPCSLSEFNSHRWSQPQCCSPAVSGNEALIHCGRHGRSYHTINNTSMTVSWISWPCLFHIFLLHCAGGAVSGQFQLEPVKSTVLQGFDVQFNATVGGPWEVMTWNVGGFLVLTVSKAIGIIPSTDQFSARFCSQNSSCVEFTIHNVTRSQSGPVICTVQGDYGQKTAQLNVQENGTISITGASMKVMQDQQVKFQCGTSGWYPKPNVTWTLNGNAVNSSLDNTTNDGVSFNSTSVLTFQAVRNTTVKCLASIDALTYPQSTSVFLVVVPKPTDWTVLIAVVVSFGGCALLILLIIGIIFCCKRRKEKQPNYQDDMRRVRTQSQLSGAHAPRNKQGQVNTTYVPEGQTSAASEITDSGFFQVSDVANSVQVGSGCNTVDNSGFMKHRHATIV